MVAPFGDLAARAGVSSEAVALLRDADVVDLHLESFIPPRLWGYDLHERHGLGMLRGRYFGHLDFPRALGSGLTGAQWSIATNVLRTARGRLHAVRDNLDRLREAVCMHAGMRVVSTHAEYCEAREAGAHAAMLAVQGGNAFEAAPEKVATVAGGALTRVTLVHLTSSCFGRTSTPLGRSGGLTVRGKDFVRVLNGARVFVDLAHLHERGFWDALEVHDRSQPVLVTHTGVRGVTNMWRNLSDDQIKAVANTGGVVGIIFAAGFLGRPRGPSDARMVLEHVAHAMDVGGEDCVALGSDYDGAIVPPQELRDGELGYARLVQHMLEAGWSEIRIRKTLGDNFLRAFRHLGRGG